MLILDPIGLRFSITVIFISYNVLSFSSIYIQHDKFVNRFTILVLLFILSINLLIYIPHIIALLLGWDGLGIVSFILVIYYQNHKSLAAGIITALSNRVGDAILLIAIAITLNQGHWYILEIRISNSIIPQILLITIAAITKSAQIPFSSWLPAAIAAPTPVSALVHSSTLVTAGVFLLIRFYPFLHRTNYFNLILITIATSTIFIAGIRATIECDIKKIIALSTLSQLGIMITSLALNFPILTFFHILTHALFKALLFIGAGSFIHYHDHSQDLRW
jgi:NADH-ubiquinone oxidoreductase chain 5